MTDEEFRDYCAARWAEVERELATPRERKLRTHWHERWMEQWDWNGGVPVEDDFGR